MAITVSTITVGGKIAAVRIHGFRPHDGGKILQRTLGKGPYYDTPSKGVDGGNWSLEYPHGSRVLFGSFLANWYGRQLIAAKHMRLL